MAQRSAKKLSAGTGEILMQRALKNVQLFIMSYLSTPLHNHFTRWGNSPVHETAAQVYPPQNVFSNINCGTHPLESFCQVFPLH